MKTQLHAFVHTSKLNAFYYTLTNNKIFLFIAAPLHILKKNTPKPKKLKPSFPEVDKNR